MSLTQIAPPAFLPVTVAEARDHLRVDDDAEDARIAALIGVATEALDGPEGLLGRALVTQTWSLTLDRFPPLISVPLPPCQAIGSISYLDPSGSECVLDPDAYEVTGSSSNIAARIRPLRGTSWPRVGTRDDAVQVEFTAGWPLVPERLRQAILMHVAHLYENRESVITGTISALTPHGYDDLVRGYRLWSF